MKVVSVINKQEMLNERKRKRKRERLFLGVLAVLLVEVFSVLYVVNASLNQSPNKQEVRVTQVSTSVEKPILKKKLVALTFDDGPKRGTTDQLLDVLKKENVKASFFVVGQNGVANPDLLRRIKAENHVLGSHTYSHHNLTTVSKQAIENDKAKMDRLFMDTVKEEPKYLRPPYGAINQASNKLMRQPSIQWSVDSRDWVTKNTDAIVKQVKESVFDGSIVLMHDIYPETIQAIPQVIKTLKNEGYEFVTVNELLQGSTAPINYFSKKDREIIR